MLQDQIGSRNPARAPEARPARRPDYAYPVRNEQLGAPQGLQQPRIFAGAHDFFRIDRRDDADARGKSTTPIGTPKISILSLRMKGLIGQGKADVCKRN